MQTKSIFSLSFFILLLVVKLNAADIYVSLKGADNNIGTKEKPLASLQAAIRKARELRRLNHTSVQGGIKIIIAEGVYYLNSPIVIYPEDSGTKDSPTTIVAATNSKVVLSGGTPINGWKKVSTPVSGLPKSAIGKVWEVSTSSPDGQNLMFRQLWVNGNKATRARDKNGEQMNRILAWNFDQQTCVIPIHENFNATAFQGMEMVIHQWWAIANLRIKSATINGKTATLSFMQPESKLQSEHPWPAPWLSKNGNSAFYLTNSIHFLDQPGEWYQDFKKHKLYYWPKLGEQMQTAKVVAPVLENLFKIQGTADRLVSYVFVKGIDFQHSNWLLPSKQGHVPHQAGMYMLDAYKLKIPGTSDKKTLENQAWVGRPAAAVEVSFAKHTGFDSCRFEHLASTGLDFKKGTSNSLVKGNLFKDIGGSAFLIGTFSEEATEVHIPYNPTDEREICTNDTFENNLITDATNEDWGCVGIGAGYVRGINLFNNEINEVSYTGISLGWGWTKTLNAMNNNRVIGNKIHHYGKRMYDVAGIYTLSSQPNSLISQNYIDSIYVAPYAHIPDHWFYLYTDEGSSFLTIKDNWTPAQKFLQNANGPDNVWQNNGSFVADSIKNNAGLQPKYHYLLKDNFVPSHKQAINQADQNVVFELIFNPMLKLNLALINAFCKENNIPLSSVYQWQNRAVIYTVSKNPEGLQKSFRLNFKGAEVKLYNNKFYAFNREKNCRATPAKEWQHIILSANLVKDEKLQNEYLMHHATQFDKWPELSKGFCNADFQQLVIYKNDRQLMLIISIPKGSSLEELNFKTTANNPKVDEWNALMKKYQEGILGTKPDEVWVFFNPLEIEKK